MQSIATRPVSDRPAQRIAQTLQWLEQALPVRRRIVRSGDLVFQASDAFECLYIVNSGFFKIVNLSTDGREQVVGLHFKGDWLGFSGIATEHYGCDAVAMDTGEVWAVRYDDLLGASTKHPALLMALHEAMSREIGRDRETLLALCTLPADARVADFLRYWAESLEQRGLRNDQITLRMTRAEIGNYLGMTLETVSRALSKLARCDLIRFSERGRRDIEIPDVAALTTYIQRCLSPEPVLAP